MFSIDHIHLLRRHELETILPHFRPGARILEIGGGTGYQAKMIADRGFEIVSIDVPASNYRDETVHPVIPYDGRNLPFRDDAFDIVFSSNVLEHVRDLPQLHRESARVLRPGGYAVHCMPSGAWRFWTSAAHYVELAQRAAGQLGRLASRRARAGTVVSVAHNLLGLARSSAIVPRHGETGNALTELVTFSAPHWRRHFRQGRITIEREQPMGLFYTGHAIFGGRLSFEKRQALSRAIGSAAVLWVLRYGPDTSPESSGP